MSCRIQILHEPQWTVIQLVGDVFGLDTIHEMRRTLEAHSEELAGRPVAIRTESLGLVGSSCLSGIIEAAFLLRRIGVPAFIAEARPDVLDLFEIASLRSILPVFDTVELGAEELEKHP